MNPKEQKTYGPKAVCQMVGISQRQLGYWTLIGVVSSQRRVHGSKVFNRYTDPDIAVLKEVKRLTQEGFFVSKAAERVRKGLPGAPTTTNGHAPAVEGSLSILSSPATFFSRLNEEAARSDRFQNPFACVAIEIVPYPNFSGDPHLLMSEIFSSLLVQKMLYELVSYEGGLRFHWLLPQAGKNEAIDFCRKAKEIVEKSVWTTGALQVHAAAYFGTAIYIPGSRATDKEIMERANRSLESAKQTPNDTRRSDLVLSSPAVGAISRHAH